MASVIGLGSIQCQSSTQGFVGSTYARRNTGQGISSVEDDLQGGALSCFDDLAIGSKYATRVQ